MAGTMPPEVRSWTALASPEVPGVVAADPVVVLPLAAIEQHGPHLPLSTDVDICLGLLAAACVELGPEDHTYVLPVVTTGASPEHQGFPGTVGLPPERLHHTIVDIGSSLARAGVRRLVLFNSHGGNRAVMDTAALELRRRHGMLVVKATYTRFARPEHVVLPESEWIHGLHGGALETSMMMHLAPHAVRSDEIRAFPSLGEELEQHLTVVRPEGAAAFAWTAGDLNVEGVVGDPTIATPAMGEHLIRHYAGQLTAVLRDTRNFPLNRLASGPVRPGSGPARPGEERAGS